MTSGFPAQMSSIAESVSAAWRLHDLDLEWDLSLTVVFWEPDCQWHMYYNWREGLESADAFLHGLSHYWTFQRNSLLAKNSFVHNNRSAVKTFRHFVQNRAVSLLFCVQNCKTFRQPINKLWTKSILRNFCSKLIPGGYCNNLRFTGAR